MESYDYPTRQQNLSDSIRFDLENVLAMYQLSREIEQRTHSLDSAYTEFTFDPFTFTQVPQRNKRMLYDIVTEEMIPTIREQALKQTTPLKMRQRLGNLRELQEQLFFLLNKPTKTLERKLKRSDSLEERLDLIHNF
jgi:hypothetical protein